MEKETKKETKNEFKAMPMLSFAGCKKVWTLTPAWGLDFKNKNEDGTYTTDNGLLITEKEEVFGNAARIQYTVKNTSNEKITLEHFSSGYFEDIGGGLLPWYDERKFKLHICYFTWQGEAQWREVSLSDMGLYHASNHGDVNAIRLRSIGNQSTAVYFPQIFIEDTEHNKTYFFNIETTGNWFIEVSRHTDNTIRIDLNSAFYNNDNWYLNLESGEEYTASACVYGIVDGGFEEAAAAMTDYRRATAKAKLDVPYACFNDYMNCFWGMPTDEKLIPLIDKAAEVGCEVFCIDAGWQSRIKGDWEWKDNLFGEYGFSGIIKYIADKGMKPGVWLELNSITKDSEVYKSLNDCMLKRNGVETGSADMCQIDFRQPKVIEHMTKVFDRLYEKGVRFIKNDYNQTCGIGFDGDKCTGEEIRENSIAFVDFINSIMGKYPDLIIENCASGSMRTDDFMMRNFHLVSVSDQEYYDYNPSILAGMAACVQPEKCGSWSYPYPQLYGDRLEKVVDTVKTGADYSSEETVFNMINSMLGMMYLSGHIELADEENTNLISEAVKVYKEKRKFITKAYPIYPSGRFGIGKKGFYSYGLADKGNNKILLAVYRINSSEDTEVFDLRKYAGKNADVKVVYPYDFETEFTYENGKLAVKLDTPCSARLFEIINN